MEDKESKPSRSIYQDKARACLMKANTDGSLQQALQSRCGQSQEAEQQNSDARGNLPGERELTSVQDAGELARQKAKRDFIVATKSGELQRSLEGRCSAKTDQNLVAPALAPPSETPQEEGVSFVSDGFAEFSVNMSELSMCEGPDASDSPLSRAKAKEQMVQACKDGRLLTALEKGRKGKDANGQEQLIDAEILYPPTAPEAITENRDPPAQPYISAFDSTLTGYTSAFDSDLTAEQANLDDDAPPAQPYVDSAEALEPADNSELPLQELGPPSEPAALTPEHVERSLPTADDVDSAEKSLALELAPAPQSPEPETIALAELAQTVKKHTAVADESGTSKYTRDPSWMESATAEGREHQVWAANVLGTLARQIPKGKHVKRKAGLKRQSTNSILRDLGCNTGLLVPRLLGVASSPSIVAGSNFGQQGSNSIRSQLTSPADSDWMVHNTWTPPSPPAPSSVRTERTDNSRQRVPSLANAMPATGLHVSPCSSANSQKALEANLARSVVPGIDMTRVHMGYDEDEDTEDDRTGAAGQELQLPYSSAAEVPQIDMSSLQFVGAGSSAPSKQTRSSGSRNGQASRDLDGELLRPVSRGAAAAFDLRMTDSAELRQSKSAPASDLRPVVPGRRDQSKIGVTVVTALQPGPQAKSGVSRMPASTIGYPGSQFDTAGSVVAGIQRKISLDKPVAVRLPPMSKGLKGKKATVSSHVHVHHHLHYHVKRPASQPF